MNPIKRMAENFSYEFEISLEGIPYPFYEEEFPHHVKAYREMFKDKQ